MAEGAPAAAGGLGRDAPHPSTRPSAGCRRSVRASWPSRCSEASGPPARYPPRPDRPGTPTIIARLLPVGGFSADMRGADPESIINTRHNASARKETRDQPERIHRRPPRARRPARPRAARRQIREDIGDVSVTRSPGLDVGDRRAAGGHHARRPRGEDERVLEGAGRNFSIATCSSSRFAPTARASGSDLLADRAERLSAIVRKPTNYCDAAIVRYVPFATNAPQ